MLDEGIYGILKIIIFLTDQQLSNARQLLPVKDWNLFFFFFLKYI